nr:hypothetical protein [Rhodoferax sp.]
MAAKHRREGIVTAPITDLQTLAAARGANTTFVQADYPTGNAR